MAKVQNVNIAEDIIYYFYRLTTSTLENPFFFVFTQTVSVSSIYGNILTFHELIKESIITVFDQMLDTGHRPLPLQQKYLM